MNHNTEKISAINILRTTPTNDEYLYVIYGESSLPRTYFAYPRKAKSWDNIKGNVVFNAFKPTTTFMHCYADGDIRGKDQQYFHSFFKVKDNRKTVFEIFAPAPYFWFSSDIEAGTQKIQYIGIYRYSEVLLIATESIAHTEGITP